MHFKARLFLGGERVRNLTRRLLKQQQATVTLILKHIDLYKDTIKRTRESMTVHLHVSSVSFNCIVFASILFSFVLLSYSVTIVFYFVLGTSL